MLNDDTFIFYAAKHYDLRRAISPEDFEEDVKRFRYIKRLFKRYELTGELKEQLILNHIIILYNCFGKEATPLLFFRLRGYHGYLKSFLMFLDRLPPVVEYEGNEIDTSLIEADYAIVKELRKL